MSLFADGVQETWLAHRLGWRHTEADEHGLGMQANSPSIKYFFLNIIFERDDISCGCCATVYQCQRVLARDADSPAGVAFAISGLLHQPCGREFDHPICCRELRQR